MTMTPTSGKPTVRSLLLAGVVAAVVGEGTAVAQIPYRPMEDVSDSEGPNSSLYSAAQQRRGSYPTSAMPPAPPVANRFAPMAAPPGSFYEIPVLPPKEIKVNDIITIRVDLGTRVSSEGEVQRRKTGRYDAVLNDWLVLTGLRKVKVAPQTDGDPRVQASTNQQYRATAELETSESMKFEIAATISHILPNGNIVLEAHREIENNNEVWLHSLTGTCRREDIGPGNLILSKDIASLRISKKELGTVRDGYKRGWVTRFMDRFNPF